MGRLKKQLIYGSIFLLFIGLFLFLIIPRPKPTCFDKKQNQGEEGVDCGGPCPLSCEVRNLQPIKTEFLKIIFYPDNSISLLGEVINPNKDWGLNEVPATFLIYDITGRLQNKVTIDKISVLPKEVRYVVALNLQKPTNYKIGKITLQVDYNEFKWLKIDSEKIDLSFTNTKIDNKTLSGVIINENDKPISDVEMIIRFFDENGETIGVTKSFIDYILPLSEKNVTLTLPTENFVSFQASFHYLKLK